jgi:hypothetical protein
MQFGKASIALLTLCALAQGTPAVKLTLQSQSTLSYNDQLQVATIKSRGYNLGGRVKTAQPFTLMLFQTDGSGKPGDRYVATSSKDGSNVSYATSTNTSDEPANAWVTTPTCTTSIYASAGTMCGNPFPPGAPTCTVKIIDASTGSVVGTQTGFYSNSPINFGPVTSGHTYALAIYALNNTGQISQRTAACP